jgi:hypothetical protein
MKRNVDLMQTSMPSIIKAMQEANVARLVLESAYGVGDSTRTAGWIARVAYKAVVSALYIMTRSAQKHCYRVRD